MSRQSQTEQECTLPSPELNPLVNPLLGRHMGRWAEVYFTAAPDQREEAVLALLRELEGEAAAAPETSGAKANLLEPTFGQRNISESPAPLNERSAGARPKPAPLEPINHETVICHSCGADVPRAQKFCGMCGADIQRDSRDPRAQLAPQGPFPRSAPTGFREIHHSDVRTGEFIHNGAGSEELAGYEYAPEDEHNLRETVFSFGGNVAREVREERVPYRYRIYVGTALAILIGVLSLMAYRATQDWSASSRTLPQSAPSTAPQSTSGSKAQPEIAPAPKPETAASAPAGNDRRAPQEITRNAEPRVEPSRSAERTPAPPQPAVRAASPTATNPGSASQGNGSEELAVAEHFLNGSQGKARDTSQAAKWLWQAVSKQNGPATLLLSDLYLRGDGVPKNCDQARLLLDAAARKGIAGAGQRLRNLQAFGCQ